MEPELRDIIRTVATDDANGDSHTHVSLYGPHARWTVQPQNHTEFWTRYCDLIDRMKNGTDEEQPSPFANLCLAERPQLVMPQIAKLTFKFHADTDDCDSWEPYDDEFLQWLCHIYQTVISEYFRVTNENLMELVVVVLESSTHWYEEDREKGQRFLNMEVKLQFPYSRIDAGLQTRVVRPRVIQLLRTNNVLAKMQRQPIGDWEQIISSTITNEPIVMYGSSEVQGRPKLELIHIWPYINRDMLDNELIPEELALEDSFVPQNHSHVQQQTIEMDIFEENELSHWIPLFLSLGYWPTVLLPKEKVNDGGRFTTQLRMINETNQQPIAFGANRNRNRSSIDDNDTELAERMISMINQSRFLKESFWMDIGKALYVSNEGDENGLLSWIRNTERAISGLTSVPEFMQISGDLTETCRNLYNTFANSTITVKTLAEYAREDSSDAYRDWHRDWSMASMEQALSLHHTDVAIALHRVYWLDFVYCATGKGRWFRFKGHRWHEINQGIELRKAISGDFVRRFEAARANLSRQTHESTDEGFRDSGEITIKKLTTLIGKLKTVGFKSSIMTEACEFFNNDNFTRYLDSNPDLTGVTNGVLEVSGHQVLFRKAKPEDYISMCTNIPYHTNYTWQHPLVLECMQWLGQVFTDRSLLHHFLKFSASCLKGRNSDKIFPIWTGEGDNSKSMIVKLFEAALNSYCIKFPVSMISEKPGASGSASPQLARAKNTRVAFLDEPEDDIPIMKGSVKRWTGGDSFFGRFLNENGGDIQATFKMILMCNKVPIIPNADKAIRNRTRLFPFLNTWVDDKDLPGITKEGISKDGKMYYKKDPNFERRIPLMAPAFLWMMSQYFTYYYAEGLVDPVVVTEYTEAYWRDNDVYAQFAADTIQEVYTGDGERDKGARVTLSEIYSEFKIWFRDAFPTTKVPERSVVRQQLSSRWGRMIGNAWHGITILSEETPTDIGTMLRGNKTSATGTARVPAKPTILADPATIKPKDNISTKPVSPAKVVPMPIIDTQLHVTQIAVTL